LLTPPSKDPSLAHYIKAEVNFLRYPFFALTTRDLRKIDPIEYREQREEHGERQEIIDADLPGIVRLADWPSPLVLAELIGRSEAVVGHSYHLFITALVSGVPIFTRQNLSQGKYHGLQHFEGIFALPPNGEPDLEWFLARVGRTTPTASVRDTCEPLVKHWDRIVEALRSELAPTAPMLNRLWQSVPTVLEGSATRADEAVAALLQERAGAQERLRQALAAARGEAAETQERLEQALAATRGEAAATQERLEQALAATQSNAAATQERLERALGATRDEAADTQKRLDDAKGQLATAHNRLDDMIGQLTVARIETAARDVRIADIMASLSWKLTAPLRFAGRQMLKPRKRPLMNLACIRHHKLETDPYRWAAINNLFNADDLERLAATYPCDHFKLMAAYGSERHWQYEARALTRMGADVIAFPDDLSDAWLSLAHELLSPDYRAAMTTLTGCDLTHAPMEVNVFHYGPGGSMSAHRDLPEKLVTQVLYFNRSWNRAHGGCLQILRSNDPADLVAEIPPIIGYSSVVARSENSWHAVSRVANDAATSRRAVTVTFYRPGSVSTMWPPGHTTPLHRYQGADLTG